MTSISISKALAFPKRDSRTPLRLIQSAGLFLGSATLGYLNLGPELLGSGIKSTKVLALVRFAIVVIVSYADIPSKVNAQPVAVSNSTVQVDSHSPYKQNCSSTWSIGSINTCFGGVWSSALPTIVLVAMITGVLCATTLTRAGAIIAGGPNIVSYAAVDTVAVQAMKLNKWKGMVKSRRDWVTDAEGVPIKDDLRYTYRGCTINLEYANAATTAGFSIVMSIAALVYLTLETGKLAYRGEASAILQQYLAVFASVQTVATVVIAGAMIKLLNKGRGLNSAECLHETLVFTNMLPKQCVHRPSKECCENLHHVTQKWSGGRHLLTPTMIEIYRQRHLDPNTVKELARSFKHIGGPVRSEEVLSNGTKLYKQYKDGQGRNAARAEGNLQGDFNVAVISDAASDSARENWIFAFIELHGAIDRILPENLIKNSGQMALTAWLLLVTAVAIPADATVDTAISGAILGIIGIATLHTASTIQVAIEATIQQAQLERLIMVWFSVLEQVAKPLGTKCPIGVDTYYYPDWWKPLATVNTAGIQKPLGYVGPRQLIYIALTLAWLPLSCVAALVGFINGFTQQVREVGEPASSYAWYAGRVARIALNKAITGNKYTDRGKQIEESNANKNELVSMEHILRGNKMQYALHRNSSPARALEGEDPAFRSLSPTSSELLEMSRRTSMTSISEL